MKTILDLRASAKRHAADLIRHSAPPPADHQAGAAAGAARRGAPLDQHRVTPVPASGAGARITTQAGAAIRVPRCRRPRGASLMQALGAVRSDYTWCGIRCRDPPCRRTASEGAKR